MTISFVGAAFGSNAPAIPPHRAGDLLIGFAYGDGAGMTLVSPPGWTLINNGAANSNAHRLAYKIATSDAEPGGNWRDATQTIVAVYRGVDPTNPIGANSQATGASDVTYPSLTLVGAASWAVGFHGRRTGTTGMSAPAPAGTVMRSDTGESSSGRAAAIDTNGPVSSWPNVASGGGNTSRYRSVSVEIMPAGAETRSATASIALAGLAISASGRLAIHGTSSKALASLSTVSAAKLGIRAGGSGNLATLTLQAAGRVLAKGSAAITLDGVTIAARSRSPGRAQLDAQLVDATASARGRSARRAVAGIRLDDLTTIGSGAVQVGGTGRVSGQLGAVSLEARGRLRARGSVAVRLADLGAGIVGRVTIAARVAAQLGTLTVSAIGRRIVPQKTPADRVARVAAEIRTVRVAPQLRVVRVHSQEVGMPQALTWPAKDPDEVLDYQIDWSARLAGDTITDAAWDLPVGIEADREDRSASATTIWLAGGEPGRLYLLTNRITTASGRVMEQAVLITTTGR